MSLLIVLAIIAYIGARMLGDVGKDYSFQRSVHGRNEWIAKFSNPDIERELFFRLHDNPEDFADELEPVYEEIETIYKSVVESIYDENVKGDADVYGADNRKLWAERLFIDRSSREFVQNLETDTNKLRILLALRGLLRKKDAVEGAHLSLHYDNPVEGVVIKWCADKISEFGQILPFGVKALEKGNVATHDYVPPHFEKFKFHYAYPRNGWKFYG